MIGDMKQTITGREWQTILSGREQARYTRRLRRKGLDLKDVAYLEVDGGDVTAYAYHKDATHQVHAEGHCERPAIMVQNAEGVYVCSCGKTTTSRSEDPHDACLKPIVI